jgi:hypothetical protein
LPLWVGPREACRRWGDAPSRESQPVVLVLRSHPLDCSVLLCIALRFACDAWQGATANVLRTEAAMHVVRRAQASNAPEVPLLAAVPSPLQPCPTPPQDAPQCLHNTDTCDIADPVSQMPCSVSRVLPQMQPPLVQHCRSPNVGLDSPGVVSLCAGGVALHDQGQWNHIRRLTPPLHCRPPAWND